MAPFVLRNATDADLPAIFAIYNREVLHGTATWDEVEVGPDAQLVWLAEHRPPYSALVAVDGVEVAGWGSLSEYRPRPGYRFSVEDTIYVREDYLRQGIGRAILAELLARARSGGFHAVLAKVSDDNEASLRLHEAFGFFEAGREREVGFKFGRWLDLVTLQLLLPA